MPVTPTVEKDRAAAKGAEPTAVLESEPRSLAAVEPLIRLERVEKMYRMGKVDYRALREVDLAIDAGGVHRAADPLRLGMGGEEREGSADVDVLVGEVVC
jgi:hypothetical protein